MEELQKLYAAAQSALKSGLSPEQVNAALKEYGYNSLDELKARLPATSTARGAAVTAAMGATAGLYKHLMGAFVGPDNAQKMYGDEYDQFAKDHPVASPVIEGAGALATAPLLGGGNVARSLAAREIAGTATGGVMGAVSGAAHAQPGDRLKAALHGGGAGALLGLATSGVPAIGRAILPSAERTLASAIKRSPGGLAAVEARAGEIAPRGGVLADASPLLRREAEFSATYGPGVNQVRGDQLAVRQSGQAERMASDLTGALRQAPVLSKRMKALKTNRLQWADGPDGFGGLGDPEVQIGWGSSPFFAQPKVAAAVRDAEQLNLIGRMPSPTPEGTYTFKQLQMVRQNIDDAIGAAYTRGHKTLADRLKEVKVDLTNRMEDNVPGYKAVNSVYHQLLEREKALVNGFKLSQTRIDPEELRATFAALTPEAQQEFRYGLAHGLRRQLQGTKTNQSAIERLVHASEGDQEMLHTIFQSKRDLNEFLRRAKIEGDMALTLRKAFGGSPTASRTAMGTVANVAEGALNPFGILPILSRIGIKAGSERARNTMAERMAPYLFGNDPAAQARSVMERAAPGWPSWIGQTAAPIVGGELFGR